VCVCSLRYPACNSLAPYCHLWPVWAYYIFLHYFINGTIFEKEKITEKIVLRLSVQLLSDTSLIVRRIQREIIKNVHWTYYSCHTSIRLESPRQIFEKCSNTQFHNNPSNGSQVVPCGRTDRWTDRLTDVTQLTFAFHNFANTFNKVLTRGDHARPSVAYHRRLSLPRDFHEILYRHYLLKVVQQE